MSLSQALAMSLGSRGLTTIESGPISSIIGCLLDVITGHPQAIASIIGKPKPSRRVGNKCSLGREYIAGRSSVGQ